MKALILYVLVLATGGAYLAQTAADVIAWHNAQLKYNQTLY